MLIIDDRYCIWSMVVLCGISTMLDFRLVLQTLVMAGIRGAGPEYKYVATFGVGEKLSETPYVAVGAY